MLPWCHFFELNCVAVLSIVWDWSEPLPFLTPLLLTTCHANWKTEDDGYRSIVIFFVLHGRSRFLQAIADAHLERQHILRSKILFSESKLS